MRLLSINVGKKQLLEHNGRTTLSGIVKHSVGQQAVTVYADHIEGDEQADLKNHGGVDKAVYGYGFQHYPYWQQTLKRESLRYGSFGENLTLTQLDESKVNIGDIYSLGEVVLQASQPRVPCFKLGLVFDYLKMPRLFSQSLKTGVYFRVLQAGKINAGEPFERIEEAQNSVSVQALFAAYFHQPRAEAIAVIKTANQHPALAQAWKDQLEKYLARD